MSKRPFSGLIITGPTGSGKSRLAMALALQLSGDLVSCDALQVYRGLDIGTAKPSPDERSQVPHHMIDLRAPCEEFSAGDYQRLGREALMHVHEAGRLPIVTGGTGLYLRALVDGLFEGPGRSEPLRSRMRRIVERRGTQPLHRALARVDPESATRIMPTDVSRILRAYEVFLLTGKPMSWWQDQPANRLEGFRFLRLAINWPREILYERINHRVEEMFKAGLVDEVRNLMSSHSRECIAFKAIGYKQVRDHLEDKITLEQAKEGMMRESRRYAKRQITWSRADPEIIWLDGTMGEDRLTAEALRLTRSFLDQ